MRRPLGDAQLHVATDHQVRELLAGRGLGVGRAGHPAAAQDRDLVRDLEDLVELVGDEDDRRAGLREAADDAEQLLRLERREHGGRLVEDEDVALAVERLEDLDPLAHADGQVLDLRVGVDVEVVVLGELDDALAGGLAVEGAEDPRHAFRPQRDRLHDVEDRDELEVLVDHPDPGLDRLARIREGPRRSVDEDLARVRPVQAGQDVHQGPLAGAVLTEQAEDLAAVGRDRDRVVGQHAGKLLRDVLELEAHGIRGFLWMQAARPRTGRGRAGWCRVGGSSAT